MTHLHFYLYFILTFVAFIAATIDTLAGGGGLITVPAILLTGMNPVMALGTSKLQSAIGELSACLYFMKDKNINYKLLKMGFLFVIMGSIIGTVLLQITPTVKLEDIIPWLLLSVLIYFIWTQRAKFQDNTSQNLIPENKRFFGLGSAIGFYNGFFGPGTGSIWALALMRVFKLNLQQATIYAKPLNLAGNLSALSIFIVAGRVNFLAALLMGLGSYVGGKCGASLVVYKDIKWLKITFLLIMSVSTAATFWKYY